jgi:hypothetical protein
MLLRKVLYNERGHIPAKNPHPVPGIEGHL